MPSHEEENEVKPLLLAIALPWWRCKAYYYMLLQDERRKRHPQGVIVSRRGIPCGCPITSAVGAGSARPETFTEKHPRKNIHGKHPRKTSIQYFNNFGYFNIIMWVYSGRHIGLPLRLSYSFLFLWVCSGQADPAPTVNGWMLSGAPTRDARTVISVIFFLVFTNKIVSLR